MTNIYLTGCTHFGHSNIIKLCSRPFTSVTHMNDSLVENWNKTVKPSDTVYHLGDFSFKGGHSYEYQKLLNGNIIRIRGNHDKDARNYPYYVEFVHDGRLVVLMHYPIEEWNGYFRKSVHFHCHTHSQTFKSAERRGNVGVDATNFTPIHIDDAIRRVI